MPNYIIKQSWNPTPCGLEFIAVGDSLDPKDLLGEDNFTGKCWPVCYAIDTAQNGSSISDVPPIDAWANNCNKSDPPNLVAITMLKSNGYRNPEIYGSVVFCGRDDRGKPAPLSSGQLVWLRAMMLLTYEACYLAWKLASNQGNLASNQGDNEKGGAR